MITVFDREREQGRFRGSSEGAEGSNEGIVEAQQPKPELASSVSAQHDNSNILSFTNR